MVWKHKSPAIIHAPAEALDKYGNPRIGGGCPSSRRMMMAGGGGGLCTPDYSNSGGTGDRTGSITVTTDIGTNVGAIGNLVDGANTASPSNAWASTADAASGKYIRFDFGAGASKLITEVKWYLDRADQPTMTFKWQGSDNASSWTDIGSNFNLNDATTETIDLSGNVTGYRYYQVEGVSGTMSAAVNNQEVEFKICE